MPKKYKKVKPACSECGWNVDRCSDMDATQREAYPAATRHCTGYRSQPEVENQPEPAPPQALRSARRRASDAPKGQQDPWDILKVSPEARVLVLRDDNGIYTTFYSDTGKAADLAELPILHVPEGDAYIRASVTVLSYFLAQVMILPFAKKFVEFIKALPTEWGMTGQQLLGWLKSVGQHDWHQRTIDKGQDKGTVLPMRCRVCGAVKRPDGASASAPVALRACGRDEGPCLGKTN